MNGIRFGWNQAKNLANQRKHGVNFEEASQVFWDPLHLAVADRVVDDEQSWQTLGSSRRTAGDLILLLVARTVREDLEEGLFIEAIRIISARRATLEERTKL